MSRNIFLFLVFIFWAGFSHAFTGDEYLENPVQEERAQALFKALRCVVCQGQSLYDSNALVAHDIRMLIRSQIVKGKNDKEIQQYLIERYGDSILLTPPVEGRTLVLWVFPIAALLVGGTAVLWALRRRRYRKKASHT